MRWVEQLFHRRFVELESPLYAGIERPTRWRAGQWFSILIDIRRVVVLVQGTAADFGAYGIVHEGGIGPETEQRDISVVAPSSI